ncbi:hypothetical protein AX768_26010 [Burkholderia sp. PAMC 28687]|jgi:hypothetical protein|nr:hypothetical protein AX768_26010 [Burkholderia sp. PAMC 28687]
MRFLDGDAPIQQDLTKAAGLLNSTSNAVRAMAQMLGFDRTTVANQHAGGFARRSSYGIVLRA